MDLVIVKEKDGMILFSFVYDFVIPLNAQPALFLLIDSGPYLVTASCLVCVRSVLQSLPSSTLNCPRSGENLQVAEEPRLTSLLTKTWLNLENMSFPDTNKNISFREINFVGRILKSLKFSENNFVYRDTQERQARFCK